MDASNSLDLFTDIIQSPTDHRHYAMVELDNGLRCTLIHDPQAQQSTAALAVAAGHFQDPEDTQGLAHFLEHMLFLGTEDFPQATAYQDYIHQHGGNHNAWTGTEYSSYYFHCDANAFVGALERFSRFFYQPLFKHEWIAKEIQAVESEYRLKRNDELRRLYQVHKATANPAHPFRKFSVGNLDTLSPNGSTTHLEQRLREFFRQWYRANRMTLVLAGPQSLTDLAQLAQHHFAPIQGNGPEKTALTHPLYLPEQLGIRLNVRPLKDARRLILAFALPGIDADYRNKTTSFIAHMLGYEGPGSLYAELHRRNLINSLSAGGGISGSNFKDFNINMQLTDSGMHAIDTIVEQVFAAIQLIRDQGLEDWRYAERQTAIANAFRFQEPARTSDLAPQLAINMHHYAPQDVIFGDYRMDGLDLQQAQRLLSHMTPEYLRATLIHKEVEVDSFEPLYGTHYQFRPISIAQQQLWHKPPATWAKLAQPNPYLRELGAPAEIESPQHQHPQFELVESGLTLWWLHDPDFRAPKAHIYSQFTLPNATASAHHYACARLWAELMIDRLNEACYDAEIAGLHFNIYPQQYGLTLHVSGYSPGVVKLTEHLLAAFKTTHFNTERWQDIQQKLTANWQSALANKPLNLLFARLNVLLQPHMYSLTDLANALGNLSEADFAHWQSTLFETAELKIFAHGDLPRMTLEPLLLRAQQDFALTSGLQESIPPTRSIQNLKQEGRWQTRGNLQTRHKDHAAMLVIQTAGSSILEQTTLLLLNQFIQPHLFNQLRTHEQLGYLVGSTYMPIEQRPQLLLYVQSSQYDSQYLYERIEHFRSTFIAQLADLADELPKIQNFLVQKLREPDVNLRLRSQRLWTCIAAPHVTFDRLEKIAQTLEKNDSYFFLNEIRKVLSATEQQGFLSATPKEL
ncbi:insulinase family protein [Pseudidiomarina salilacus]|uniref:insulinase family protein n=1 Tax=Pseudidiomarina salilacus TaxID=3384452 RepID=UPI003984BA17